MRGTRWSLLLLALLPAMARAGGFDLAWNDCWPQSGETATFFACNTNTGIAATAVGSFRPDADIPNFIVMEATLDLMSSQSTPTTLQPWWQTFNSGTCRQSAVIASADFTTLPHTQCLDPWEGNAAGGISLFQTPSGATGDPRSARIRVAFALPFPVPVSAGFDYDAFKLRINASKTVGAGACSGCDIPVCIGLSYIRLYADGMSTSVELLTQAQTNQFISWQCGATTAGGHDEPPGGSFHDLIPILCTANSGGCAATPVKSVTWGRIQAHYR